MPDLDLGPNDYRKQDRRGRWYQPDDPRVLWLGLVFGVLILGWTYWNRDQLLDNTSNLLLLTAGAGACVGGIIVLLMAHYDIN